jgi:hypothetical protein
MNPLPIPVPPQLEAAVGYVGDARWISFCWTCCGDCPWIDDGRGSMTGTPYGLLAFWRHPAVAPHLRDADLGSSEQDGTQRLVIDRQERRAYLASSATARSVVCGQWPAEPAVELTREEWDAVVERIRLAMLNRPIPSIADLMRQLQEHSRLVADMIRFLDLWHAGHAGG